MVRRSLLWSISITAVCLVIMSGNAAAAVYYVMPGGAGTGNGTSWADAEDSLQDAVDAASGAGGGEIWVAAGTYTGISDFVVTMAENVHLYGGFTGTESSREERNWVINATVINGQNTRQCVWNADNTTLDGFTITRGYSPQYGGGMVNGPPISSVVANCIFTANSAEINGGGMYNLGASPVITNCIFTLNYAGYFGGGMYNGHESPVITNCTFTANSASQGGGISNYSTTAVITNTIVWGNEDNEIHNGGTSLPTVAFSCVEGGHAGMGNISTDPLFFDGIDGGDGFNLRLQPGSLCIDNGTGISAPAADILGCIRPVGDGIDMGAYEHTALAIDQGDGPLVVLMSEDGHPTPWIAPALSATASPGITLFWRLLTPPVYGRAAVSGTGASPTFFDYIPDADYNGGDSFEIQVSDTYFTDTIMVEVAIEPVNDAPVINPNGLLEVALSEDGDPIAWAAPALSATDVDGDTLTWSLLVAPSHGVATVSGTGVSPEIFTYAPDAGYNGNDHFVIEVSDGALSDTVVVSVTVGTGPTPLSVTVPGASPVELNVGDSHSFTAMVLGGQSGFHYQWYFQPANEKNAKAFTPLGEADECTLALMNISETQAGAYYCRVWTSTASAESNIIQVIVTPGVPVSSGFTLAVLVLLLCLITAGTLCRKSALC